MILKTISGTTIDSQDVQASRVLSMKKRLRFNGWLIALLGLFFFPLWLMFFWREKYYQVQLKLKIENGDFPTILITKDEYNILNEVLASGDMWDNPRVQIK